MHRGKKNKVAVIAVIHTATTNALPRGATAELSAVASSYSQRAFPKPTEVGSWVKCPFPVHKKSATANQCAKVSFAVVHAWCFVQIIESSDNRNLDN